MLRTQTTSLIVQALIDWKKDQRPITLVAPGLVYRRDVRDKTHCGQPHQMDIWVVMEKDRADPDALMALIRTVCVAALQTEELQCLASEHPYTQHGIEISAKWENGWLEIGEAGLIDPMLLERLGIDSARWGGLAMGVGVDRLVMARKRLPDIRLLRDTWPSVSVQMRDLLPWRSISRQPVAVREISVARAGEVVEERLVEEILMAISVAANWVQQVEIVAVHNVGDVPSVGRERLGMTEEQNNVLLRITWQAEGRSLPREQINMLMGKIYRAIHHGHSWTYCPG